MHPILAHGAVLAPRWRSNGMRWIVGTVLSLLFSAVGAAEAWIYVTSDPPLAEIWVDGRYRGVTPSLPGDSLRIQLDSGDHQVLGESRNEEQHFTAVRTIFVGTGSAPSIHLELKPSATGASLGEKAAEGGESAPDRGVSFAFRLAIPGRNF